MKKLMESSSIENSVSSHTQLFISNILLSIPKYPVSKCSTNVRENVSSMSGVRPSTSLLSIEQPQSYPEDWIEK